MDTIACRFQNGQIPRLRARAAGKIGDAFGGAARSPSQPRENLRLQPGPRRIGVDQEPPAAGSCRVLAKRELDLRNSFRRAAAQNRPRPEPPHRQLDGLAVNFHSQSACAPSPPARERAPDPAIQIQDEILRGRTQESLCLRQARIVKARQQLLERRGTVAIEPTRSMEKNPAPS